MNHTLVSCNAKNKGETQPPHVTYGLFTKMEKKSISPIFIGLGPDKGIQYI